ncbi:hypothetical protein [uncultured Thiodictyon sp.]|nr:hypothetical protein [uncultured Thiodictyon sp.]
MSPADRVFLDAGLFIEDWRVFSPDGIVIAGPPSMLQVLTH